MTGIQKVFSEGLTKLFVGVGGFSIENFCFIFSFEAEIPEELKK